MHSSPIASLTKRQHTYAMQFTEEILSFTPLLLELTVGIVGIRTPAIRGHEAGSKTIRIVAYPRY